MLLQESWIDQIYQMENLYHYVKDGLLGIAN